MGIRLASSKTECGVQGSTEDALCSLQMLGNTVVLRRVEVKVRRRKCVSSHWEGTTLQWRVDGNRASLLEHMY